MSLGEGREHFSILIFYYQHAKSEVLDGHTDKDIKMFVVCYRYMVLFNQTLEYLISEFVEFLIEMLK